MNDNIDEKKIIEEKISILEEKKIYYKLKRFEKKELKTLRKKLIEIKDGKNDYKNAINGELQNTIDEKVFLEEETKEEEKTYIGEYIETHKIKEYEQVPQYLSEKEDDSELVKNCGKTINKYDLDIPIIIV